MSLAPSGSAASSARAVPSGQTRRPPASLARAGALVAPALEEAASRLEPSLRRIVEYHWGLVDADGARVAGSSGKRLRPTLALLSAEAVGASADRALAGAVAVELVHDFTLLHDDVMDDDRERRGRPAAWVTFGMAPALCAGDALSLLAQRVLLDDASPRRLEAVASLAEAAATVIDGQMLDLALEGRVDASVDEYLAMASKKTGALLGCAASLGAILAEAPAGQVRALRAFGDALGLAFQAVDDWLGIWGDPARTGKPAASDLRQRKSSLPIVLALAWENRRDGSGELARFMARDVPASDAAIAQARACVERSGAAGATRALAQRELARALACLDAAALAPEARREQRELAAFVVERDL